MSQPPAAVAVIVPSFNNEKVLRACLESIRAQTHRPAELVVVDDRSTDRSRDIAREFRDAYAADPAAPRCRLVELPVNRGPSGARNAGVAASSAPLLFFVDSDTALLPDAIENALTVLRDNPDAAMVQGLYDPEPLFDDGPVEAYQLTFECYWRPRDVGARAVTLFTASLITREAFEAAGGFDERLRYIEDDEFGTRLPERYRVVVTDTVRTRHDDEDRLLPLLRVQFRRGRVKPSIMLRAWRLRRSGAAGARVEMMTPVSRLRYLDWSGRVSLATPASLLLTLPGAVFWPRLLLALPVLVAAFVVGNSGFLRFAYRSRGAVFAAQAAGLHLLVHLTLVVGHGVGMTRVAWQLLARRPRTEAAGV